MKLLTKKLAAKLPPLYAQDGLGDEAIVHAKWFTPDADWTWFCTEHDPETGQCFGLVSGEHEELGYFNLNELRTLRGPLGLPVERDLHWTPKTINECRGDRVYG